MLGYPRNRSKVWWALDPEIGESGENRGQIVAHWVPLLDCRCVSSSFDYESSQLVIM
jgi:hypothetical protein